MAFGVQYVGHLAHREMEIRRRPKGEYEDKAAAIAYAHTAAAEESRHTPMHVYVRDLTNGTPGKVLGEYHRGQRVIAAAK